ncbi:hypothetical protein [Xenorhabdus bovienii]|uniref:Uncharacterized protein n=1 Tax=Xenorhabdus bovienii str. feltiae Moldova TaxID=1398200 RepID=A0A077NN10_XENBV|nr:hypothetical protein [Xenorhabdus bovienii]CDG89511.1 conserved hypothetical protein [Xenorhabdus bovienii str. feltiae France]CDG92358.1 conserved hypothetical protein [Xenorhabdus bovienii str. feltiae Florida]CDG99758.1 conserved hypothetical protein [Xenorhabdus bovienii str. feltiae Moldova]
MNDRFTEKTKRVIQERVGNRCSNPDCNILTSGPNAHPEKSTKTGVAAHITAASPGGARYDSSLNSEQRKSAENGIWLCQNCAHFIDTDYLKYPVRRLYEWKNKAECEAERGTKRMIDKSTSRDDIKFIEQEEGWICPFCGTVVGVEKLVCIGCHAEVVPGLTRAERNELVKTGMMAGGGLSALLFLILPSWIASYFDIRLNLFGHNYIYVFICISVIMVFVIGKFFVYFSEKSRLQKPPRFFRNSIR